MSALQMASAYATFAASGTTGMPYAVERIERSALGEIKAVSDHKVEGSRVLSGNQAADTEVLRTVVLGGTASLYHNLYRGIEHPSADKTGTSEEFADA